MNTNAKGPLLAVALAAGAGLVGLAAIVRQEPKLAPEPLKPRFEAKAPPVETPVAVAPKTKADPKPLPTVREEAVVRTVTMEEGRATLSKTVAIRPGQNPQTAALAGTLANLGYSDVRVLGTSVDAGVLTADVSSGLQSHGFGSEEESVLIKALQETLGQFERVKSFRLRSDGQVIDTLGHFEMTEPVPVTRDGKEDATASKPANP